MLESSNAQQVLRGAGLRLTPQRRAVVDVLCGDTTHPTADVVAERVGAKMDGVSLSTVYKVLHELSDLNLIREIEVDGVTHFDSNPEDHIHVVCSTCDHIADVAVSDDMKAKLSDSLSGIVSSITQVDIVVEGVCTACAEK